MFRVPSSVRPRTRYQNRPQPAPRPHAPQNGRSIIHPPLRADAQVHASPVHRARHPTWGRPCPRLCTVQACTTRYVRYVSYLGACPFLAASYDQWSPRGRRIRPRRRFGCRRQVDRYSRSRARQTGAHFACLLFFLKKRRGFVGRGAVNTRLRWPWAMDAPTAHVCPSPPTARPAAACPRNRGTVRDPDTTTPGLLN